jgi:hypothetical protein
MSPDAGWGCSQFIMEENFENDISGAIKNGLDRGYTLDSIRNSLINAGYKRQKVDETIESNPDLKRMAEDERISLVKSQEIITSSNDDAIPPRKSKIDFFKPISQMEIVDNSLVNEERKVENRDDDRHETKIGDSDRRDDSVDKRGSDRHEDNSRDVHRDDDRRDDYKREGREDRRDGEKRDGDRRSDYDRRDSDIRDSDRRSDYDRRDGDRDNDRGGRSEHRENYNNKEVEQDNSQEQASELQQVRTSSAKSGMSAGTIVLILLFLLVLAIAGGVALWIFRDSVADILR